MKLGYAIAGSTLGSAALTYFFDPVSGRRRRTVARDFFKSRARDLGHFLEMSLRDMRNRTVGVFGEARYRIKGRHVEDDRLVQRVAAKLGRYVSHPKVIGVTVDQGRVTLSGPILSQEIMPVVKAIGAIPGVKDVKSELEAHAEPDIPGLQGGRMRRGDRKDFFQTNWAPATRLILGAAGSTITWDGIRRSSPLGGAEAALGSLLLARCSANRPIRRLLTFPALT